MVGGDGLGRSRALRPGDPAQLGAYRIVGRLGQGGMGLVYLAESSEGRRVALKVIRDELADDEFRRRFRSEVARARQVPPFCTAEVIDADTEHDPPYLVVEYVDGPSLSAVVSDQGPLTPANQQGLAVGVAVALTAIHGAGVIHRDLKPSNVLLAPGSPKVIDFGIARAVAGTDFETRTNQMVGTVAYMAPERFDSKAVTPAADIFAWGALIGYAATGRTPFAAETPAATAIRIMTGEPDLDGLTGSLRELVEWSLTKDPDGRPEARDLLDHLLAGGTRGKARPASFKQQPEVLAAAGFSGLGSGTPAAPAGPTAVVPRTPAAPTAAEETVTAALATVPAMPTVPHIAPPPPPVRPPATRPPGPRPGPPQRRGGARLAITALALSVLVLSGAVAAFLTGALPLNRNAGGTPGPTTATVATTPAATSASTPPATATSSSPPTTTPPVTDGPDTIVPPGSASLAKDPLTEEKYWSETRLARIGASCAFAGELRATLGERTAGSYRCRSRLGAVADFSLLVDVKLTNLDSCAGVWFRFTDNDTGGYVLKICRDQIQLATHSRSTFTSVDFTTVDPPIAPGTPTRVGIRAQGEILRFFADGRRLFEYRDSSLLTGKISLGVLPYNSGARSPFQVSFANIEIWKPPLAE